MIFDFCIVGGGIVGLATGLALLEARPGASLLLLEKEEAFARHQSGHNSGVVHAGIYYAPGSLKARLCREGLEATFAFCREHRIPFEQCGKLIVATDAVEEKRIDDLYVRAAANNISLQRLSGGELKEREPRIRGRSALLSPKTGIVDFVRVAQTMAQLLEKQGATLLVGRKVTRIREQGDRVEVGAGDATWFARRLVVCGGAQADRLARMAGLRTDFRVVPFRGEYFRLPASKNDIVAHLIYPAPDPSLPFLGVHLTRMIDGSVTVGPNAVLGLAREGYAKFSIAPRDIADFVTYPGFWKLIFQQRRHALHELKGSLLRSAYLAECRKYCEELQLSDLLPYRAGIRAQIITRAGEPVHDFLFQQTERMLHVCNAPSPAATSAIPIGKMIAEKSLAAAL